jgi:hypothetical protein
LRGAIAKALKIALATLTPALLVVGAGGAIFADAIEIGVPRPLVFVALAATIVWVYRNL